jgi:AAA domain
LAVTRALLLRGFKIDPSRGGDRVARLPFLSRGAVEVQLRGPLTFLVGENGSGKTTLLEAIAARCAIRPGGGHSYAETDDERDETALSDDGTRQAYKIHQPLAACLWPSPFPSYNVCPFCFR